MDLKTEEDAAEVIATFVADLKHQPGIRTIVERLRTVRERFNEAIRDFEDELYERRLPPRMVRIDDDTTLAWDGERFQIVQRHEWTPILQSSMKLRLRAMNPNVLNELRTMIYAGEKP